MEYYNNKKNDLKALEENRVLEMKRAAAPDMYEALQDAFFEIEYLRWKYLEPGTDNQILARIEAALAKADGVTVVELYRPSAQDDGVKTETV